MNRQSFSRFTAAAVLGTCVALVPCGQRAALASNEIGIRLSNTFAAGDELAAVADDNLLMQAELSYAHALMPLWRGTLWLEGSYLFGKQGTAIFDTMETDAWFHQLSAGARFDLPIWHWLHIHARLGLGLGIATLSLERIGGATDTFESASDVAFGVAGHALVGLQLLWPSFLVRYSGGGGVTAGLVVEGGGTFASDLSFALRPETDGDRVSLPLESSELGSINPSGGVLRVGAFVRF